MSDLKVEFPEPCSERWEDMSSRGCHRHCATCDKVIHDLAALTIEEAEALLAREEEACVRAEIGRGGVVRLKPSGRSTGRRMVAAAGASLALASAACQTVPDEAAPRYAISGQLNDRYASKITLYSDNGKSKRRRIKTMPGEFAFTNLAPGTYTLYVEGDCGYSAQGPKLTIVDRSLNLGEVQFTEESSEWGCPIIVGRIRPVDRPEMG
ncbi:carboxypeptidase-like regulatory domain-containing protein [Erythrobacter oryzae]|uniref:carboxypeptidase-like regulatory domain-containing protein n=1 Tax=Erythrobacter oryzae TaxID=3019556 RepID=UPI0025570032|nr:carboxypeptidase-like regulatory domain-containing protein [Erythrobacter sp. COR-2]